MEGYGMNQPEVVVLEADCPRCGAKMNLPLPADCDRATAMRLSKLVLCSNCMPDHHAPERPQARTARLPYADE